MLAQKLLSGGEEEKLYVDDVFSAYTYTGNGTTQTINNGIDLAGKGGMVWTKSRTTAGSNHGLMDTVRGGGNLLMSNATNANSDLASNLITSFNSNGFTTGPGWGSLVNQNGDAYVSWTFRKAPKFFDVVTYTGDGAAGRQIPHSLGVAPGMVIIKRTNASSGWKVTHVAGPNLELNTTAQNGIPGNLTGGFCNVLTATIFGVTKYDTSDAVNATGAQYVAYLFAHDTSTDGIIQCGSFTTDGGGIAPDVELGWEPQYVLFKPSSGAGNWNIVDNSRNFSLASPYNENLSPNLSSAAVNYGRLTLKATGFKVGSDVNSQTHIYMAIRRPNKPPTSGTQVYNAIARTGTGAAATVTGVGFAPDLQLSAVRGSAGFEPSAIDRLRGSRFSSTNTTAAEAAGAGGGTYSMIQDGFQVSNYFNNSINGSGLTLINHFFKRAPGVFDQVCYRGTGGYQLIPHSLGVMPELVIVKSITSSANWVVVRPNAAEWNNIYYLNTTGYYTSPTPACFGGGTTATAIDPYQNSLTNQNASNYVAYLFATKAGISKVGSYTGNGATQTINCGFTTGARFVLIKNSSSTGDWYVWDSTRGIVAGNDPHLSLNTTAAEVTTDDSVDPETSGFIVNQVAATNINVNAATYIFLSFA